MEEFTERVEISTFAGNSSLPGAERGRRNKQFKKVNYKEKKLKQRKNCKAKLLKSYNEWRSLQKGSKRRIPSQISKEENFKTILEDLFDVAHKDALENAAEEVKMFLLQQRRRGRRDTLAGVDVEYAESQAPRELQRKRAQTTKEL
ncbi:hypothetical protein GE061_002845 [Apolygus lucorum]|uniref:Uncharacterized protein n=1 Tax=Apolygus lucorum TaxID=248454 RepID=A0A8S9X695_APOLU|nr:hypothetical protein GE061_002845 [Apolygus lucorum]